MQFKEIDNQYAIANHLTEIIDSGRISHAQLFLGDTTSGSLALAIAYAQYLNCTNRQHFDNAGPASLRADSCGECPSCKKYKQLIHTDLHLFFPSVKTEKIKSSSYCSEDLQEDFRAFLAANSQRGTLNDWYLFLGTDKQGLIRERDADLMTQQLALTSYEGGYKVAIFWMAEKINTVAANKILKVLEEPAPRTLILLVAESSDDILSTILSRSQTVAIPRQETVTTHNEEFAQLYVSWMRQLFKLNMASLSAWVDTMHSKGREPQKQFLQYALEATRDCFLRHNAGLPPTLDFGDEKFNGSFPAMVTTNNIERINDAFNNAIFAIERNGYAKIVFMELSFRISKALKKR